MQDAVMSLLDEGVVALVPTDTWKDPIQTDSYDILTMRTGKIVSWYPQYVRVRLYNERTGQHEEVTLPKSMVAIVENPLYAVMNEPNSTLQRLIRKLVLLDVMDEHNSSGKLDLIIQLPYVIKSKARQDQAEQRRKQIEDQLAGSKYGIAYTDGTEK
ncbi:MAG: phage portal protein, partial [Clostridiales bacterium]|nr:phage portal protein [Clostridiales bacterium]